MNPNCDVLTLVAYDTFQAATAATAPIYDVAGCIAEINGRGLTAGEWKCLKSPLGDYTSRCYDDSAWPPAVGAFAGCTNASTNTAGCPYLALNAAATPGQLGVATPVPGISPAAGWFWTAGYGGGPPLSAPTTVAATAVVDQSIVCRFKWRGW